MGWFKSFKKKAKKVATKVVKSKFGKAMDTAVAAFAQPVSTFKAITTKSTFKQQTKSFKEKPLSTQISKIAVSAIGYATLVTGAGAIATKGVGAVAKSLIPKTLKGKAIAYVAAPTIAAIVIKQPEVIEKVSEIPATAFQAGSVAADPSVEGVVEFVKEHPIVTAVGVAAGGVIVGKAAVAVSTIIGKEKEITSVAPVAPAIIQQIQPPPAQQLVAEKPVGIEGVPQTPETTTVTTGKRRYKRRRATKPQSIRQSVNFNIVNRPTSTGIRNTNYLKEQLLN